MRTNAFEVIFRVRYWVPHVRRSGTHAATPTVGWLLHCYCKKQEISSAPRPGGQQWAALVKAPLLSFRLISRTRWPTKSRDGLERASGVGPGLALSEHGPCFVGGTMTLDDVSFNMKIACISRATLDSERHWAPVDLGTGSIGWAPKRLRGYCGGPSSAYLPAIRHRRALAKWEPLMHESSGSLSSSSCSIAHPSTVKAAPTASPISPSRCYGVQQQ